MVQRSGLAERLFDFPNFRLVLSNAFRISIQMDSIFVSYNFYLIQDFHVAPQILFTVTNEFSFKFCPLCET